MRHIFFTILCLCMTIGLHAQTISEIAGSTTTVNVVGGETFVDPNEDGQGGVGGDCSTTSSGNIGDYPNCDCITTTTLTAPAGQQVQVTFSTFRIFGNFDWFAIFDGDGAITATNGSGSASNPTSGDTELWNSSVDGDELIDMTNAGTVTFTSTNGSLTFASRFSGVVNTCGWEGTVAVTGGVDPCAMDAEPPVANCPAPASGPNVLTNPSFEVNNGNDQPFNNDYFAFGPAFTLDATAVDGGSAAGAATGTFFLKTFGAVSGIFQDHPVTPGDNVTAMVDVISASFDPMLPGCRGLVKVEFFNAGGAEISETEGNVVFHTIPTNTAVKSTVYAVAPPGAVSVRYVAVMLCDAGGAVFFDNASMQISSGDTNGNFVLANDAGQCGAVFNYGIPAATDNCSTPTTMADVPSGSLFSVGTTPVTVTATDDAGNTSSCTFNVTVNDTEAPIANCPEPPSAGGNLLLNGSFENNNGFDSPFSTNWTPFDVASAVRVSDGRTGIAAQDGNSYLKMFGGNTGIFQDVPVTPGENLTASVYLLNAFFDPMLPGCEGFLKLEYINSSGGIFLVEESARLNNSTPQNVWTEITMNSTVPAGATAVRFVVIMQCSAGGAVFFDDASLASDAPPTAGDFMIDYDPDLCMATVSFTVPPASDNCPAPFTMASPPSGTMLPVGPNTITVTAMDAAGNSSVCTVNVDVVAPLPCGYDSASIGCAGDEAAGFDDASGTFTLTSDDCTPGFPYTGDSQSFIFTELCGDGYVKAFVENVNGDGFGGVQMRNTLDPGSKKIEVGTNRVDRVIRAARALDNYPAYPQEFYSLDKFWVKIERTGSFFKAFVSVDDVVYTPILFQAIQMNACIEAGLYVYSKTGGTVDATFTNVEVVNFGAGLQAEPTTIAQSEMINSSLNIGLTPNPARDLVTLNLDQVIGEAATISIFNMNGQLMNMIQYDSIEDANEEINISDLPVGTYYVNVKTASTQQTLKLIKQ